jgi:hypothetical protein
MCCTGTVHCGPDRVGSAYTSHRAVSDGFTTLCALGGEGAAGGCPGPAGGKPVEQAAWQRVWLSGGRQGVGAAMPQGARSSSSSSNSSSSSSICLCGSHGSECSSRSSLRCYAAAAAAAAAAVTQQNSSSSTSSPCGPKDRTQQDETGLPSP